MTSPRDVLPTVLKTKAAGRNNEWGGKAAPLIIFVRSEIKMIMDN